MMTSASTETSRRTALGLELLDAAALQNIGLIKHLLNQSDLDVDYQDGLGRSALFIAAKNEAYHVAAHLLHAGASPLPQWIGGYGPIQIFASRGWIDLIETSLQSGIHVDVLDARGDTLLMHASSAPNPAMVEHLLAHGACVDLRQPHTMHAVMHMASLGGCVRTLSRLEEAGADMAARSAMRATPLHFAARAGSKDACEWLIERGAQIEARTLHGYTPLMMATIAGDTGTVMTLLSAGADDACASNCGTTFLRQLSADRHQGLRQAYMAWRARNVMRSTMGAALSNRIHHGGNFLS
jgi:ankyrin repeat protein